MAYSKHNLGFLLHASGAAHDAAATPDRTLTTSMRSLSLHRRQLVSPRTDQAKTHRIRTMRRRTLATPQSSTTSRVPWDVIVATLETYKRLHGNLQVAQAFEVPVNDERWPAGAWGLRLGCRVHNLRIAKNTLHEAKRQALDAVGFEWQGPRQSISFELKLAALTAFKAAYGHVRVPQKFTLPHADVLWTGDELKLGCVVNKLRQSQRLRRGKKGAMPKGHVDALNDLGFEWSATMDT